MGCKVWGLIVSLLGIRELRYERPGFSLGFSFIPSSGSGKELAFERVHYHT